MSVSIFDEFDDLEMVHGSDLPQDAVTCFVILRNEMYFLPAFLQHYRRLGVERFVVLDDHSDDGSSELLMDQPDVAVVRSKYRYGDTLPLSETLKHKNASSRVLYVWRSLLHSRFAMGRWAMQVDADEFAILPEGRKLRDIVDELEHAPFDVVWSVMLDVYPCDFQELMSRREQSALDMTGPWFFDGEPHLKLNTAGTAKVLHPGARARLYHKFGLSKMYSELGMRPYKERSLRKRLWKRYVKGIPPRYNNLKKPLLVRWRSDAAYINSHQTTLTASGEHLLPLVHYRFAGSIYDKIDMALRENSYSSNSRDHKLMASLLKEMAAKQASFKYKNSKQVGGFDAFNSTGNAYGFEGLQIQQASRASANKG